MTTDSFTIDRFDRALLERVRRNNRTPARELAEAVGLSESAVLRRLRDLRAAGVIAADVSIIRPDAFGRHLTMHVLVTMERESSAVLDGFVKMIRKRPEVRQAWYVTGGRAYLLLVQVAAMEDYERFTREALSDNPNVRVFETMITIRQVVDEANAAPIPFPD